LKPNTLDLKQYSQQRILLALIDGEWHRNKELKEKTKLTPRTLSKHLYELERKFRWIERREDTESGEYPHPVLYRATSSIVTMTIVMKTVFDNADDIETILKETKDPLQILEEFHKINEYYFTLILETIQKTKSTYPEWIDPLMDFVFYEPYKIYTKEIVRAFTKVVRSDAEIDINNLRQRHNVWDGDNRKPNIQYRMKWKLP
jgi:DNA-binding HxlR family transcriptional regulator